MVSYVATSGENNLPRDTLPEFRKKILAGVLKAPWSSTRDASFPHN
jgi:hypothetical protein